MTGVVNDEYEAVIDLRVYGLAAEVAVTALIDTGFTGMLTLPPAVVSAARLPWLTRGRAVMADGSVHRYDVHEAEIEWDGERRIISVSAFGDIPLIGTEFLIGHELRAEFAPGGAVELRPLA